MDDGIVFNALLKIEDVNSPLLYVGDQSLPTHMYI